MAKRSKDGSAFTTHLLSPKQYKHNLEVQARRKEISAAMVAGIFNIGELLEIAARAGYKCQYADIARDMVAIRADWRETISANAESARQIHETQLWKIYNTQIVAGETANAVKTLESIRTMNGVDAPKRVHKTGDSELGISISDAAIDRISKELSKNAG